MESNITKDGKHAISSISHGKVLINLVSRESNMMMKQAEPNIIEVECISQETYKIGERKTRSNETSSPKCNHQNMVLGSRLRRRSGVPRVRIKNPMCISHHHKVEKQKPNCLIGKIQADITRILKHAETLPFPSKRHLQLPPAQDIRPYVMHPKE